MKRCCQGRFGAVTSTLTIHSDIFSVISLSIGKFREFSNHSADQETNSHGKTSHCTCSMPWIADAAFDN